MNYRYEKVDPHLSNYVRTLLVLEDFPDSKSSNLPLFTNGMPTLLCKAKSDKHGITLFGQSVPRKNWTIESNATLFAFFFKPFAIGTIFKLSAKELKEKSIELNLWNPQKAIALRTQFLHAKSSKEKIEILNHFVHSQIQVNQRDCEIIRIATDKLMQDTSSTALSQLLNELHLTERTFQRIFKKYLGITANEYRRICQFQFALSQLKGGYFDKQTDVAYANGYFDQSHYIRSFKGFTDTTPDKYLQDGLTHK